MKKGFYILLLFIFVLACNSDDDSSANDSSPLVQTESAIYSNNGIVTLSGILQANGNEITLRGFEYSTDSLILDNKIIVNADTTTENKFNYTINSGIEENIKYFFKAFVKSNNTTFYGQTNNFKIDVSAGIPEIDSISSDFGHIADTLILYGRNFVDNTNSTSVDFSEIHSSVISISDTLIKCIVPSNINQITSDIQVRIGNKMGVYSSFQLYAPEITLINPIESTIGDTISIYGDHFDIQNSRNDIYFGTILTNPITSARDSLQVVVPLDIESTSETITVEAQLQQDSYDEKFTLATPVIFSISPLQATFRDDLTITGDNFGAGIISNKVFFGNIEATVIFANKNMIITRVPDDIENSTETIRVESQLQEVTFNQNFTLIPPKINFVEEQVYTNQEVEIQGAFFHPILEKNIVTIEDIEVESTSNSTESFSTQIPWGPFPRRKAIVRVQVLDLIAEYEIELTILDPWIMISNSIPFRFNRFFNNAMVANNEAFVIAPIANSGRSLFYLWKFNSNDFSWEQSSLPFTVESTGTATSNGENLYVYTAESDKGFWEYNPLNDQWTQKSSFPGGRRDWPTHFSLNNDIYIGIGANFDTYPSSSYPDFFKYNPSTDTWTTLADFPYQNYLSRTETSTFVLNDIAYMGNGARNTGMYDYWSYHPTTDEWIRIADFPDARHNTAAFSLNGYGFVTGGTPVGGSNRKDCWRYDPATNTWLQVDNIANLERAGHFSFSLNGKAYIGGGGIYNSGGTTGYDFYEFIP